MANDASFTVILDSQGGAQVLQSLHQIGDAAEQNADRTVKAYDRQTSAAEKFAAKQQDLKRQAEALFSGPTAMQAPVGAGSASASTVDDLAQQRRMQAAALGLRDALNPAMVAQRAYNAEVAGAKALLDRGLISQVEYNSAMGLAEAALKKATQAHKDHTGALGLNRMQFITAQSAVMRFTDSIIAGRNPLTAFALEAHKGAEVLSLDEGGMAGGLSKVAGLVTPATVGIAAFTIAIIASAAAAFQYAESLDRLSRAADGFGRTSQMTGAELLEVARSAAQAGNISVGAAQDIEQAILHQTRTSGDALEGAIKITQRFADAMGIDTKQAAQELAKAMADPVKGADELAEKYGYLTQKQVEEIHQLMEQNRLTEAQTRLMADLDGSLDEAGEHVNALTRAWRGLSEAMSQGWANIGSAISQAMGVQSDAEKMAGLQHTIASQIAMLNQGVRWNPGEREKAEQELRANQTKYAQMMGAEQRKTNDARHNQLAQEVVDIERASGATNRYSLKLEEHRQVIAKLHEAMALGIAVDPTVLAGKEHQLRGEELIGGAGNAEVAMQQARQRMRNAMPHSAARAAAASDIEAIKTAGQDMTDAQAAAADKARGQAALGHGKAGGDKRAETAARAAAAMNAEAAASLSLADAYLKSGDAALKAEAWRKAATDATRKGTDVEAAYQRQLNLMVAEQVANAAKGVRSMEDETAARNKVLAAVKAGTVPASEMEAALTRENALRPLLTLETVAQGDAKVKLIEIIKRETQALNDNEASLKAQAAQQAIAAANDNARAEQVRASLSGVRDPVERAKAQALADAAAKKWSASDSLAYSDAQGDLAGKKQGADTAEWFANEQHKHELAMQLAQAQANGDQEAIARITLLNQLDGQNITLTDEQIKQTLDWQKAEKTLTDQTKQHQQTIQQLRDIGGNALDQLLNPDNINHWGSTFKSVIKDVLVELEKMALINPLKNMLMGGGGGSGGGGGGLGSLLGSLFGGGGGFSLETSMPDVGSIANTDTSGLASMIGDIPAFATGTDDAPGGPSLVGEYGPELVNLPSGAKVMTASETRGNLQSAGGGNTFHMPVIINAQGAGPREVDVLRAEINNLRRDIPSMAIQASNDARARRVVGA